MQRRDFLKGLLSLPIVVFSPLAVARFLSKEEPQLHREDEGETQGQIQLPSETLEQLFREALWKQQHVVFFGPQSGQIIRGIDFIKTDKAIITPCHNKDAVEAYLFVFIHPTKENEVELQYYYGRIVISGYCVKNLKTKELRPIINEEVRRTVREMADLIMDDFGKNFEVYPTEAVTHPWWNREEVPHRKVSLATMKRVHDACKRSQP